MSENMKPSGIKWIKDIPSSWNIIKVKHLATDKNSLFLDGDWIESDVIEESGIRYLTTGNVGVGYYKEQGSGYISEKTFRDLHCLKVLPYDLMVSRLNEPIGRACIVPNNESFYVVAVDNVIIRPNKNFNKRFLMYVMNTDGYAENGNIIARGATMSRVSRSQLGQFWISYPELSEQTLIANFLDEQCKKIDSIVTDIENQIEILQKYKKSLITETVTKGLDKSVPMKDSGIEWIGDVPDHWEVKRIKHCCTIIGSGTTPESSNFEYYDGDYAWIQSGDLYGRDIIISTEKTITQLAANTYSTLKMYQADYVVVAMYGASVGNVAISKIDAYVNQACCVLAQDSRSDVRYLFYWLVHCKEDLIQQSFGGGQPNISQQKIRNEPMLSLPLYDQIQIANYLDEKCTKIDSIIVSKKEQLTKITQHKKSLIYEYVTGKKRVKGENNNGN